jgi:transposase
LKEQGLQARGGSEVYDVNVRDQIRDWVLMQGRSQRSAAQRFAVSRDTVARMLLEAPEEPERRYQRGAPRLTPVRDSVLPHLEEWLRENARLQRWAPKQRWTAHRMWIELRQRGIEVAESTVRQLVRERRVARRELAQQKAYIPLAFAPAERGEVDFGHAVVRLAGQEQHVPFLAARLRSSGAMFVAVFPTERQDAFLLGQRWAFEFWGGVPRQVVYDNLKPAVARILRGHSRQEQQVFRHFHSVYGFEAVFANPHAGWEKGSVENLVGYARRAYFVPIPQAESFEALNAWLRTHCAADQQRVMAGRSTSIADRLAEERPLLTPLPERPVAVGELREALVRSTGRVRFETNDYSAPVRYVGSRVTLQADPFTVRLFAGVELVAQHPRSYARGQIVEDFRHYVPLLLEKPFAVPFASPVRNGGLSPAWDSFRQRLVVEREGLGLHDGNREFARILQLCLTHSVAEVEAALALAAEGRHYSADAVRQLVHWADEPAPSTVPLDAARYPEYHLPQPRPDLAAYNRLLGGRAPRDLRAEHSQAEHVSATESVGGAGKGDRE